MKELSLNKIEHVSGGWGAKDMCKPEFGFNPAIHDCFDGGAIPKREPKPSHHEVLPKAV